MAARLLRPSRPGARMTELAARQTRGRARGAHRAKGPLRQQCFALDRLGSLSFLFNPPARNGFPRRAPGPHLLFDRGSQGVEGRCVRAGTRSPRRGRFLVYKCASAC
jgi:hypothetical protein